jgi:hypothetical protein
MAQDARLHPAPLKIFLYFCRVKESEVISAASLVEE